MTREEDELRYYLQRREMERRAREHRYIPPELIVYGGLILTGAVIALGALVIPLLRLWMLAPLAVMILLGILVWLHVRRRRRHTRLAQRADAQHAAWMNGDDALGMWGVPTDSSEWIKRINEIVNRNTGEIGKK